jgi:hypothetical protein
MLDACYSNCCRKLAREIVGLGVLALVSISFDPAFAAAPFYSNTFETGEVGDRLGAEWSSNTRINSTPNGRHFLGGPIDQRFGLSNEQAELTLARLPRHNIVTLSFSLLVIDAWTGARVDSDGQDIFQVRVDHSATPLVKTTFSNSSDGQHYPGPYGGEIFPPQTGATEVNTLGYGNLWNGDSVYNLSFTFDHAASNLNVSFGVSGLVGPGKIDQESWGLDNVAFYLGLTALPIPEAPTSILVVIALALVSIARARSARARA